MQKSVQKAKFPSIGATIRTHEESPCLPYAKKILAVLDLVGSKVCFEADLVKLTEGSITKKGERSNIQGKIISDLYFLIEFRMSRKFGLGLSRARQIVLEHKKKVT